MPSIRYGRLNVEFIVSPTCTYMPVASLYTQLAVQAATGAARHTSLQALFSLQLQLYSESGDASNDQAFTSRLARVVSKLFARVIKAEEATDEAYEHGRLDMEALVCSMEDTLVACHATNDEGNSNKDHLCSDMVRSLILSIIGAHGNAARLLQLMNVLQIDSPESALVGMVSECAREVALSGKANDNTKSKMQIVSAESSSLDASNRATPSKDVASLVARLGHAPTGAERESALDAIRTYKSTYGGEELDAHLKQLSGAFRDFIEDQINGDPSPQKQPPAEHSGTSVSERIRSLRSRLQATELAVNLAVEDVVPVPADSLPHPEISSTQQSTSTKTAAPVSNLVAPSPSKLARPSPTKIVAVESRLPAPGQSKLPGMSSSAQSLRERLAARQELRQAADGGGDAQSVTTTGSFGRAAALRARLEVVKQQSILEEE